MIFKNMVTRCYIARSIIACTLRR